MSRLQLSGIYDDQSGARGANMVFPAGMAMGMAQRDFGQGTI